MSTAEHDSITLPGFIETANANALAAHLLARFKALYEHTEKIMTLGNAHYLPEGAAHDLAVNRLRARQEEIADQVSGLRGLSVDTLAAIAEALEHTYWETDYTVGHSRLMWCLVENLAKVAGVRGNSDCHI